MKYFLHYTNSFSDDKITLLHIEFGFEAVGLYYVILEKLAAQEKPVLEIVLKKQLNIKKRLQKQLSFMYKIEILSLVNGGVFSENILKNTENYQEKKEKNRKRISEWRANKEVKENVTCNEHVRNTSNIIKDNKSKVNNIYKTSLLSSLKNEDVDNSEYLEYAISFYELFKKNLTENNISTTRIEKATGKWIDPIRLLLENDKYSTDDLRTVWKFLNSDDFWKKNIMSTQKLREKFDRLLMDAKIKNKTNGTYKRPITKEACTADELKQVLSKHFD
jgi:hypothetical protein